MRHKGWMSTVAHHTGLVALVNLVMQPDWLNFVPAIAILYMIGSWTFSVGYHRLFCHASFKTHPFWHWFFSVFGVVFMYASSIQWGVTHQTHHIHSDTPLDPHPTPWMALVSKTYRYVPLNVWMARRLMRQSPCHKFVDMNYVQIYMMACGAMLMVSPDFFIYVYLPALGLAQLVGGLHNTFSHTGGKPRNFWFLEYILPAGGEWMHGLHHEKPRLWDLRTKWYHMDSGSLLIRLIRSNK
jgi:fatty-acid desaturase